MLVIVDGYNVLKQMGSGLYVDDAQRDAFIKKLSTYAHEKNNSVIIVFDGGEYVRPTHYKYGPVTVIYAGHNDSADDVIKQIVMRGVNPAHTVIVSSDREICSFVGNFRVATIDSQDFYKLLASAQTSKSTGPYTLTGQLKKAEGYHSSTELDNLMREAASIQVYKDEPHPDTQRISSSKKDTKHEKKLKRLVKKL